MTNFPIVVCGTITTDNIFKHDGNISSYFRNNTKDIQVNLTANFHQKCFGGTAANIAYNLSLLNINCRIMASVGCDFYEFKSFLNKRRINTDWIEELKDDITSTCAIFCDTEDNHIDMFYPGSMYNDRNLSLYNKNIDGLMLAIITPTDTKSMLIRSEECIFLKIPYIFDPGLFIESFDVQDLIFCCNNARILIMNEKEFNRLLNHTGLCFDDMLKISSTIIITKGGEGSALFINSKLIDIPAIAPKHIFDAIGAGDAYKAGLAFGIINKLPIIDCCRIAAVISSFNIEFQGAMNHSFTEKLFIERYKEHFHESDNMINNILKC